MHRLAAIVSVASSLALLSPATSAQGLRIGIQEDPDALDPATSGFFVGRVVFAALCDKLIEIGPGLEFQAQLATSWRWSDDDRVLTLVLRPGVRFHDGEPLDAAAVKINLDRYRTAPESRRKAETRAIADVEVVDPLTVRLRLSEPFAPLLSVLADRAGMMMSPKALTALGDKIGSAPVCAGPFRFVRRVAQERIELARFDRYWNAAEIKVDAITYTVVPDSSVRLLNLRAGALDMIERLAPSDMRILRADASLKLVATPALAYQALVINVGNGPRSGSPLGRDPRVREALELALDRDAINRVVFDGEFVPGNQAEASGSRFFAADRPAPSRDVARARALLRQAGHERLGLALTVINNPTDSQLAQVIQSMAAEAGFDIRIEALEAAAHLAAATRGVFDVALMPWSGRVDPDGNIAIWIQCDGFANVGKHCRPEVDAMLTRARSVNDAEQRRQIYSQIAHAYLDERPMIFLFHAKWLWAMRAAVQGFAPRADGLIRPQGISIAN
ncbi:MAG: ABC transporter substrate-binding protein [Alphaproteobacteria bacterium]|nr:ABC transporter substrate-binding protein [Alphaproteobacteria bacterium]